MDMEARVGIEGCWKALILRDFEFAIPSFRQSGVTHRTACSGTGQNVRAANRARDLVDL